jgi:hypothetical protein
VSADAHQDSPNEDKNLDDKPAIMRQRWFVVLFGACKDAIFYIPRMGDVPKRNLPESP